VSGNSCKNLREIQRSDQKLCPFRTGTFVYNDETSASPSSDSTSTTRKTVSVNCFKNLREFERTDQKLCPFRTGTLCGARRPPRHRVAVSYKLQGKQRPESPEKVWGISNGRIKRYDPFEPVLWSWATRPSPHRVAIPNLLQGKHRLETPEKIWGISNNRI